MTRLGADLRAFGAAAFKELRITRRYPAMYLGMIFWPVLLPAVWVLMAQAYSGLISHAMKCRLVHWHATAVVPLPTNGSKTISPSFV